MKTAALVADELAVSKQKAWIKRISVDFDEDVWLAVEDRGYGPKFGPLRAIDENVTADVRKFPGVKVRRDGNLVGIRTQQELAPNTLYALGLPHEYVLDFQRVGFPRFDGQLDGPFVSPDYRIVYLHHFRDSGLLQIEARVAHDAHRCADIIGDRLKIPSSPGLLARAGVVLRKAFEKEPGKAFELVGNIVSLFGGAPPMPK